MTKYIFLFWKYISGLTAILVFANYFRICRKLFLDWMILLKFATVVESDFTNSSTKICIRSCNFNIFYQISKIYWDCPLLNSVRWWWPFQHGKQSHKQQEFFATCTSISNSSVGSPKSLNSKSGLASCGSSCKGLKSFHFVFPSSWSINVWNRKHNEHSTISKSVNLFSSS